MEFHLTQSFWGFPALQDWLGRVFMTDRWMGLISPRNFPHSVKFGGPVPNFHEDLPLGTHPTTPCSLLGAKKSEGKLESERGMLTMGERSGPELRQGV